MNELTAKTPKQLDICLRLLHAEGVPFEVRVCENEKGKIYYSVAADCPAEAFEALEKKYRVLL